MQHSQFRLCAALASGVIALAAIACSAPALALDPAPEEEKAIKGCERKLCTMVLGRVKSGPDLRCELAKTWDRDTLKKGDSSSVSWGFGDARCALDLTLSRADIVGALTSPKYTINIPEHEVQCIVEQDGKPRNVVIRLAPKLKFKDGKAEKIWINLADIKGPSAVSATVQLAASLEDSLGLFHRGMIKSVNKFLHKKCDQLYFADGRPKEDPAEAKKADAKGPDKAANPVAAIAK